MYDDDDTLTREQAEACLPLIQAYIDRTAGPGWTVNLFPPGHECDHWVASLECGSDCWPYVISEPGTVTWPDGVAVGAVNHLALSLHPA